MALHRLLFVLSVLVTLTSLASCYLPYQAYCGPNVSSQPELRPSINRGLSFSSTPQNNPNSGSFKLLHSQVVTRHGDRTIIDRGTCWAGDSASYQCTLTTTAVPNNNLSQSSETTPQSLFRLNFLDGFNYQPGNCSGGALSSKGYKQLINSGSNLRQQYIINSSFLSKNLNTTQVYFRTDNELRTLQSAESMILGLYPETVQSGNVEVLDIWSMDYDLDDMQVNTHICPVVNDLYTEAVFSPTLQQYNLTTIQPLFNNLSSIVGYKVTASNFYHVWDCAVVHKCWSKSLPRGMDSALFDEMNEVITYVSEYVYTYPTRQLGSQTGIGFLLKEIYAAVNSAVQAAMSGQPISPQFLLYSGHDTTILPILAAYDISDHLWPSYASYIVIELYQNVSSSSSSKPKEDDLFIRFVYNGNPLSLPGCDSSIGDGLCQYSVYKETTQTLIPPDDYESFCASTSRFLGRSAERNRKLKEEGRRTRGGVERGPRALSTTEKHSDSDVEEKLQLLSFVKSLTQMRASM